MAILWCGGEDVDYPRGSGTAFVGTSGSSQFRTAYARCAIINSGTLANFLQSLPFPGGAVTSAWLTYRYAPQNTSANRVHGGLTLSATSKGIFIGTDTSTSGKLAIVKYDGTTRTQLAAESGTSITTTGVVYKLDLQVTSYGASATVNLYVNGALVATYTGDVTVSGMSSFDSFSIAGGSNNYFSEVIVSDSDTRSIVGLQTLALTGAGTTANWTGSTFSNINGTTISDASPASSNTSNQVQDYNVTNAVAGTYNILAVKIAARMAKSSTPAVTQVQLGYNDGSGSSGAGTGSAKAVTTSYATYEQFDATNPITSTAWAIGDITPLQLEITAKT